MAGEDVLQAFLLEHRERFAQAVEQVGRRRVGEIACLVVGKHLVPGPIGAREFRRLRRLARPFAHAIERQAGRQHQAFLRAGDGDVDAPLVVAVVDRSKRGNRVDHVERGVSCRIDRLAYRADAGCDSGRSLVVHDAHGLDPLLAIFLELGLDRNRIDAAAPVGGDEVDREAELRRHLVPQRSEMPGLEHEHAVARRERVDERRLPGAGARGGIDHDGRPGLEHGLEPFEDLQPHGAELGAAMIHRGAVDRAQNAVGHVGRPGDLQEMASAPVGHDLLAYRGRTASLSEKLRASMIWLKAAVSWSTRFQGIPMALCIDIISDVVCPWCFIGKRRTEAALELFRQRLPQAPAPEIAYHPFELNPDIPRQGIPRADYIAKKFGARGYSAHDRLVHAGAQLGIPFAFDKITRQPNTLAAHALIELARRRGVQGAVKEALLKAFFVEGADLSDAETLARVAAEAGLARADAEAALGDEELRRAVADEEEKARAMGVSGVPFFIFNKRLAVEGAQPPEVLLEAMLEAEKESTAA